MEMINYVSNKIVFFPLFKNKKRSRVFTKTNKSEIHMKHSSEMRGRYLFILPWSLDSIGGVNEVVKNLYYQFKINQKYEPIIMVNSWNDIVSRKDNISGYDHFFLRLRNPFNRKNLFRNFILFILEIPSSFAFLRRFLKKNNVYCVNMHYCSLSCFSLLLLKFVGLYRGRIVLSFHGRDTQALIKSKGLEKILWNIAFRLSDSIVACSKALMEEICCFDRELSRKTSYIHNGVDIATTPFASQKDNVKELKNMNYLLNVGTLEHQKGHDVLLQAFKQVHKKFDTLNLVIIGRKGDAEPNIKKMIHSLGLSDRVRLYEGLPHDEVLLYMENAKGFVLPSRYESFGIVILEAGLYGLPVIASNVGGIPEIISHNETGRLFEPGDIDALANELSYLLSNPDERARLGRNLKKHVNDNFSWEKTYKKYLIAAKI